MGGSNRGMRCYLDRSFRVLAGCLGEFDVVVFLGGFCGCASACSCAAARVRLHEARHTASTPTLQSTPVGRERKCSQQKEEALCLVEVNVQHHRSS